MDLRVAAATVVLLRHRLRKQKKRKSKWVRALFQTREMSAALLCRMDMDHFQNFTRMSPEDIEKILNLISPVIAKKNTNFRESISSKLRLQITLRYLATGDSDTSLQYLFKVSKQCIPSVIPQTCKAINTALAHYVKLPSTPDEWLKIADEFEKRWNFPLCIGALDGKHCVISSPIHSGSDYFNYQSDFSIVLLALVDADYNFIFVDIGSQGRISDGGVFKSTCLYRKIERNELGQPKHIYVEEMRQIMPFVIVADSAFGLTTRVMIPYPGVHAKGTLERNFNYRLSRARRIAENAFGILSAVFRVLRKPMLLRPETAQTVVYTTTLLHNFLRKSRTSRNLYTAADSIDHEDENGNIIPGSWREGAASAALSFLPLRNMPRRATANAKDIRDTFAHYFHYNRISR